MKSGFLSWAVLFTRKPVQNVLPPVEMTPTEGISFRQASPSGHTTSTLQEPDSGAPPGGGAPKPR